MPFVPVPKTALAELRFTMGGQQIENTLWFENVAVLTQEMLDDLATTLAEWWEDNLQGSLASALCLNSVYVTDQSSSGGLYTDFVLPTPDCGGNGGESMPNVAALVVSFRTALRGRSFRGRNYITGIDVANCTFNSWSSAIQGVVADAYELLTPEVTELGFQHVVVSRFSGGAPRVTGVTTPVECYSVDPTVRVQRRREVGVGS